MKALDLMLEKDDVTNFDALRLPNSFARRRLMLDAKLPSLYYYYCDCNTGVFVSVVFINYLKSEVDLKELESYPE